MTPDLLVAQSDSKPGNSGEFKSSFKEVWAYLMAGEESFLRNGFPISDLGYFGAGLNSYGELTDVPDVSLLKGFTGRKHLVLAILDNYALTHIAVFPNFPVRAKLLDDVAKASAPFDGVQLDFESVPRRDKEHFWSFLTELKKRLPEKCISVAIPARSVFVDDAYNYASLSALVDRVIVMAYDEHWSGSLPGPVASMAWCRDVATYSRSQIAFEKLVVGAPFYGRAWTDKSLARAYKHSAITRILGTRNSAALKRTDNIPEFEYEESVHVHVYYEDKQSLGERMKLYSDLGIKNVAFWRLGQEDPEFWSSFR